MFGRGGGEDDSAGSEDSGWYRGGVGNVTHGGGEKRIVAGGVGKVTGEDSDAGGGSNGNGMVETCFYTFGTGSSIGSDDTYGELVVCGEGSRWDGEETKGCRSSYGSHNVFGRVYKKRASVSIVRRGRV